MVEIDTFNIATRMSTLTQMDRISENRATAEYIVEQRDRAQYGPTTSGAISMDNGIGLREEIMEQVDGAATGDRVSWEDKLSSFFAERVKALTASVKGRLDVCPSCLKRHQKGLKRC